VITGIGLLNKPSMLFLAGAVVVGFLLTPQRRHLFDRWAFISGLVALLIASPSSGRSRTVGQPSSFWLE
jgi:hypothetical protein